MSQPLLKLESVFFKCFSSMLRDFVWYLDTFQKSVSQFKVGILKQYVSFYMLLCATFTFSICVNLFPYRSFLYLLMTYHLSRNYIVPLFSASQFLSVFFAFPLGPVRFCVLGCVGCSFSSRRFCLPQPCLFWFLSLFPTLPFTLIFYLWKNAHVSIFILILKNWHSYSYSLAHFLRCVLLQTPIIRMTCHLLYQFYHMINRK